MAFVIAQPCIDVKDKACVDVCPVDCIHSGDEDAQMFINPDECTWCAACAIECPVAAIYEDADLPPEWKHFEQKNAAYFKTQPA
jgi:NAD-dependent dihydropyrimidine dehydrogenase PreA subunit